MSRIDVDTARLPRLLNERRLPAISRMWADLAVKSDKEGWPAVRLLSAPRSLEVNRSVGRTNRIIIPEPKSHELRLNLSQAPCPQRPDGPVLARARSSHRAKSPITRKIRKYLDM